jgi:hypothetical protein
MPYSGDKVGKKIIIVFFDNNKEVIHFYLSNSDSIEKDVKLNISRLRKEAGKDEAGNELEINYCLWDNWFASEMCDCLTKRGNK